MENAEEIQIKVTLSQHNPRLEIAIPTLMFKILLSGDFFGVRVRKFPSRVGMICVLPSQTHFAEERLSSGSVANAIRPEGCIRYEQGR